MSRVTIGTFSLDVGPAWTLTTVILAGPTGESSAGSRLLTSQAPNQFQQNLVAVMEQVGSDETPRNYFDRQIEGLRKAGINRQEAKEPEQVEVGGRDGLLTEQVVSSPTGEWVRQMQLISIKDGVAYTLIATHLEGEPFERARDSFRAMLLSFV